MTSNDFLTDESGDLLEENGDWVEGASDDQHIYDLIDLEPGELKLDPLIGVGIRKAVNGVIDGGVERNIYLQLQADKYRIKSLSFNYPNVDIDAEREG